MKSPWFLSIFAVLVLVTRCLAEENPIARFEKKRDELQAKEAELVAAKGDRRSNMLDRQLLEVRIELQSAVSEIARLRYAQVEEANRLVPGAISKDEVSRWKYESDREALLLRKLRLTARSHDARDLLPIDVEIAACDVNLAHLAIWAVRRAPRGSTKRGELEKLQRSYVEAAIRHHGLEDRLKKVSPND